MANTQSPSVPAPAAPAWEPPRLPRRGHRRWALPLASLGLVVGAATTLGSVIPVDRYADAPGDSHGVQRRVAVSKVATYLPQGEILFVTVTGAKLSAVQAVAGWLEPHVDEQTRLERFGPRTPEEDRRASLKAMRTAKNDAPYVALSRLGYPTERTPGPVIVQTVFCVEVAADAKSCSVSYPADEFLDAGDQIVAIDGRPIEVYADFEAALVGKRPGDQAEVTVKRAWAEGDETETANVEMVSAGGDEPERPIFGIMLGDTTVVEIPFAVDIATDKIGGPSAGLAFTLAVLDVLTPGELTGGQRIAVTGTIDVDGQVGVIGGLRQKALSVRDAGGTAFIVPKDQSDEDLAAAREILGADRVHPVGTLDEALAVLIRMGGNADELGTPGLGFVAT